MKKIYFLILFAIVSMFAIAQDSISVPNDTISMYGELSEISVTSVYYSNSNTLQLLNVEALQKFDFAQEPSYIISHMPNIYAANDNGTEMGYGYFRIRGLDQTRINVTLDGMPWNEAEDFGAYFANSPDLVSSLHSMKVENGSSAKVGGVSAAAGSIIMESVDLRNDTISYANLQYGHFNSYAGSIVYNMGLKKGWGFHIKGYIGHTDGYKDKSWNNSKALTAKIGYWFNNYNSLSFLTMNGYHDNGQGWIGSTYDELKENSRHNGCMNYSQYKNNDTDWWIQSINKLQYDGSVDEHYSVSASVFLQYQNGSYSYDWMTAPKDTVSDMGLTYYMYGLNCINKLHYIFGDVIFGTTFYNYQRRHFSTLDRFNGDGTVIVPTGDGYAYDNIGHKRDIQAFINTKIHMARWADFSMDFQYRNVFFRYNETIPINGANTPKTSLVDVYDFFNGGFGFDFHPALGHAIYAKLIVTNREPTRSSQFGGYEYYMAEYYTKLEPELIHDVEVGYNLNINKIKMNVNIFYMHFKNELILTGAMGPNGLPAHQNAEKSYRYGAEFSADWECYAGLHFINSTGLMDGRLKVKNDDFKYKHVQSPNMTIDQTVLYERQCNKIFWFSIAGNLNLRSEIIYDLWAQSKADDPSVYTLPLNYSLNIIAKAKLYKRYEFALKLNNITRPTNCGADKTNYVNATISDGTTYYFQNAGFNMLGIFRVYF